MVKLAEKLVLLKSQSPLQKFSSPAFTIPGQENEMSCTCTFQCAESCLVCVTVLPLSAVCMCVPLHVCVCRFQLVSTLRCGCKMLPPGSILATAPFAVSCSSSGISSSDSPGVSPHRALPAPPALWYSNAACLSLPVPLSCTSQPSLRSQRDAPLVCADTLLGFSISLSLSFSVCVCLPRSYPPLPSPSSAQVKALAVWRWRSADHSCREGKEVERGRESQREREREHERERTLFQGVEKGGEGREDEPAFCSLAECTTSPSQPFFSSLTSLSSIHICVLCWYPLFLGCF